ncbi:hypothetical protein AYI69_g4669 [Smittium culicis]|uniref:Uncharacterized protein n=1 Tax=Smittium culicis TaxID=133412 RepID=A0A1R1YBQ5_9FUNG|nr:hypothetical protein AYI69_g4669 [Smittium culicis]
MSIINDYRIPFDNKSQVPFNTLIKVRTSFRTNRLADFQNQAQSYNQELTHQRFLLWRKRSQTQETRKFLNRINSQSHGTRRVNKK